MPVTRKHSLKFPKDLISVYDISCKLIKVLRVLNALLTINSKYD